MGKKAKLILKGISEESGQPFKREIRTLDEVRESGQYTLVGYNVSEDEGLPPAEYDDCNYCFIEALLSVTRNSSSSGYVQKETIGQTITISNREDGGTNIYNRSWSMGKNNEEWTPWLMMLRGDISVVAPSNDLNEKVSVVAESLRTENERAENAEKGLKDAIDAETANAKLAHDSIKSDITEQSNRITQTNINLHKCGTVRFDSIEENVVEINKGEIGIENPHVVYYKPENIFVAVDNAGNYWDTWSGMASYMSGGMIRKDKVYLYREDVFRCTKDGYLTNSYPEIKTNDIAAGVSLKKYILVDYYYNTSGVLTKNTDSTKFYRALPLLKISTRFTISLTAWQKCIGFNTRCFGATGSYIGDAEVKEEERTDGERIRTLTPIENTEYIGIYWQKGNNVEEEDFDKYRIEGIYNIILQENVESVEKLAKNIVGLDYLNNNALFIQENNLLSNTTFTDGYLTSAGTILDSDAYKTSDYILIHTNLIRGDKLRFVAWCNANKEIIEFISHNNPLEAVVYEKPQEALFVRVTAYTNEEKSPRLYTVDTAKDARYLIQNGAIVQTLNLGLSLGSINLFNPNDNEVLIGKYIAADYIYESTSYNTSGYISVRKKTKYFTAANANRGCRYVNFYDENKKYISDISDGTSKGIRAFITPDNCRYIRVVFYANDYNYSQIAECYTNCIEYSEKTLLTVLPTCGSKNSLVTRNDIYNVLYEKKWAVCGDSFTAGFSNDMPSDWFIENGLYAGKSKVYGYLIANRNNMRLQWLAVGGRTIATPADGSFTNAFSHEGFYDAIDEDVDYITLYFGINDSHHAPGSAGDDGEDKTGVIPLGTINDTTRDTFYGAWNVVIPYLIEHHPFAKIGIIVSNGCDTPEYRQAEIEIAKKYGIPYIDLNGDEKTPCMIRSKNETISSEIRNLRTMQQSIDYDGSIYGSVNRHPNKDAHEYQSTFIENWMRGL